MGGQRGGGFRIKGRCNKGKILANVERRQSSDRRTVPAHHFGQNAGSERRAETGQGNCKLGSNSFRSEDRFNRRFNRRGRARQTGASGFGNGCFRQSRTARTGESRRRQKRANGQFNCRAIFSRLGRDRATKAA